MLPEELETLAVCGADKWWPGSGGWVSHCRVGVGRCWPRKAARQCVYCAVLRSCFVCLIKEVKGRQEGDGCTSVGFRMNLLGKG